MTDTRAPEIVEGETEVAAPERAVPRTPPRHTIEGDVRVHERFRSRFLPSPRSFLVYLPPDYAADRRRRYPVLYLHDGQNVFDEATSAIGQEWQVDETAQRLIAEGSIEPLIVVAICNAGKRRIDEYTPTRDAARNIGGQADQYGRMLVQEIKPFIDRRYRTLRGPPHAALGGSSLGGLVTMYLGLRYPAVFGRLAVLSPSVWWDDRVILREVEALPAKLAQRIWLDVGTAEGEDVLRDVRDLRDALMSQGWQLDQDLEYLEAEGGGHNEMSWAARVEPFLRFLFPAEPYR